MELQERAALLAKYLVVNNKEGERQGIIVKADDAPEWVTDVVYAVHGDSLPDDWVYKAIKDAADAIEEMGEEAEVEHDIYTRDLFDWFTSYPNAVDSCDRAVEEFGMSGFGSIMEQIQAGQQLAYGEIVAATIDALQEVPGDDEPEEEETEEEHTHTWGPVELSRFSGNPVRRCACGVVSMDLDDEDEE